MTDYKLTEEDKKRLTPFLGECWHKQVESKQGIFVRLVCACGQELLSYEAMNSHVDRRNRTYLTPSDQHAVFTKLVEVRKWDGFYKFFLKKANFIIPAIVGYDCVSAEVKWLFINPARFCKLVADYLDENKS